MREKERERETVGNVGWVGRDLVVVVVVIMLGGDTNFVLLFSLIVTLLLFQCICIFIMSYLC